MTGPSYVIAAVGLRFEARIAARGRGVTACCGRSEVLAGLLEDAIAPGCAGIVSFGVAGGLDPRIESGEAVVASGVVSRLGPLPVDERFSARLLARCPSAVHVPIFADDGAVLDRAGKARLFEATGAGAVDMESHVAATVASLHGLPFAALRVIVDSAGRSVPAAAMSGMRSDGSTAALPVVRALLRRPGEILDLVGLAGHALQAARSLSRLRNALGPGLGLIDLR